MRQHDVEFKGVEGTCYKAGAAEARRPGRPLCDDGGRRDSSTKLYDYIKCCGKFHILLSEISGCVCRSTRDAHRYFQLDLVLVDEILNSWNKTGYVVAPAPIYLGVQAESWSQGGGACGAAVLAAVSITHAIRPR